MNQGLSRHSMRASFPCDIGMPTGLVYRQLLHEQGAGHRGQAAADSQRPRREPAGLGGSRVAGPGRPSGFHCQLGSLCFSSASSGENLQRDLVRNPVYTCTCVYTCVYTCICIRVRVYVCLYARVCVCVCDCARAYIYVYDNTLVQMPLFFFFF